MDASGIVGGSQRSADTPRAGPPSPILSTADSIPLAGLRHDMKNERMILKQPDAARILVNNPHKYL